MRKHLNRSWLIPLLILPLLATNSTVVNNGLLMNELPVLCYHNINVNQEKEDVYHISASHFEKQIKMLYDSGYQSILPDQLYDHLTNGTPLPPKAVMLSFDDTHETHFSIVAPLLEKYKFRGVFFIMTVCIGKKNYMTAQQIRMLSERGHTIGCHSYDHLPVKIIEGEQWVQQLVRPVKKLEAITGKPVQYYAYPFGTWNAAAIPELKRHGIKAAFQLSDSRSENEPLYTIRRMLVSGAWSEMTLQKRIKREFGLSGSDKKRQGRVEAKNSCCGSSYRRIV